MSCAQSEAKQCSMQLEHNRTQLKNKQKEMMKTETEHIEDKRHLEIMEKELAGLQVCFDFRVVLDNNVLFVCSWSEYFFI